MKRRIPIILALAAIAILIAACEPGEIGGTVAGPNNPGETLPTKADASDIVTLREISEPVHQTYVRSFVLGDSGFDVLQEELSSRYHVEVDLSKAHYVTAYSPLGLVSGISYSHTTDTVRIVLVSLHDSKPPHNVRHQYLEEMQLVEDGIAVSYVDDDGVLKRVE